MDDIKKFNYDHIYNHERLDTYKKYVDIVINSLFESLMRHRNKRTGLFNYHTSSRNYPKLSSHFLDWVKKYSINHETKVKHKDHCKLYDLSLEKEYIQAVVDFISGMTDQFAILMFQEVITF